MADYDKKSGYLAPTGALNSAIVALNASGVGVGSYDDREDERRHGYVGLANDGSPERIDFQGSTSTNLHGIDDANDIVGTYDDGANVDHGFARVNKTGAYVKLDDAIPGGADTSSVTAMSASGEVAGTYTKDGTIHVFIADVGTNGFEKFATLDLKDKDGASITAATVYGVNNAGDVVGSYDKAGKQYGFVEHGGTTTTLSRGIVGQTVARGINNKGEVVGYYVDAAAHHHGFTYTDGQYATLNVENSPATEAHAVNDAGQVTGTFAIIDDDTGNRRSAGFVQTGNVITAIDPGRFTDLDLVTINQAGLAGGNTNEGQPQAAVYAVYPPPPTPTPSTANPPANTGAGGTPATITPQPVSSPPTNNTAAPSVAFDAAVAVAPGDVVTLSGTSTAAAGLGSIVVAENGVALGTASVKPDGAWSLAVDFTDRPGSNSGLTVTATDVLGHTGTAQSPFSLSTALTKADTGGEPYRTVQDRHDPATGAYTGSEYFNRNGSEYLASQLTAGPDGGATYTYAGGSFFATQDYTAFADRYAADGTLDQHSTFNAGVETAQVLAGGQTLDAGDPAAPGGTRFVFSPRLGDSTITGFVTAGPGHDRIDLGHTSPGSLASILDHAQNDGAGDTVLSIGHRNTITLAGVAPGDLTRRDFVLHA